MQRVCVYCGSHFGASSAYTDEAARLGRDLANRGLGLVYGGARVGLMGVIADAAIAEGAEVIGVIPEALIARELGHPGLTDLRIVASMHERKLEMMQLADAFVALPGGAGTLDELFEAFTWLQLGFHTNPIGLLDVDGFWGGLLAFLDHTVNQQFTEERFARLLLVDDDTDRLLERLGHWTPPQDAKSLEPTQTQT